MTINEKIKELRNEQNLTQTQLANMSGVNVVTINQIELGKHKPSALTIAKLSKALRTDIDTLWSLR